MDGPMPWGEFFAQSDLIPLYYLLFLFALALGRMAFVATLKWSRREKHTSRNI